MSNSIWTVTQIWSIAVAINFDDTYPENVFTVDEKNENFYIREQKLDLKQKNLLCLSLIIIYVA